jgi:hypothetical protein
MILTCFIKKYCGPETAEAVEEAWLLGKLDLLGELDGAVDAEPASL